MPSPKPPKPAGAQPPAAGAHNMAPDVQTAQAGSAVTDTAKDTPASTVGQVGPTQGELDELLDDNLNLKAENARLQAAQEEQNARIARLERLLQGGPAYTAPPGSVDEEPNAVLFDDEDTFGLIYGDPEVSYFQNGHYFSSDKNYVRSEHKRNLGRPRPFKPQLVGFVKRPKVVGEAA